MIEEESHAINDKSKSTSRNETQTKNELTVIYAIAREWGKPTSQARGLITIRRSQSRNVEIMILNW